MSFAIETNRCSKSFGHVRAVESVSLRVGRGEIYGFLDLNGAGKTTTLRALLGLIRPSAGSIKVLGQAVGPNGRGPFRHVGHLCSSRVLIHSRLYRSTILHQKDKQICTVTSWEYVDGRDLAPAVL